MKFLENLKSSTHNILLILCVLLFLNLMSTCSSNRRSIKLSNKVDTMEIEFKNSQKSAFEYQSLEFDKKLSENLIDQRMLFDNKLKIDSVRKKLNNILLEMNKLKKEKE